MKRSKIKESPGEILWNIFTENIQEDLTVGSLNGVK